MFGDPGVRVRGTGRGGKAVDRVFTGRELAAWSGARGRKGRFLEPRVREVRLELPRVVPSS